MSALPSVSLRLVPTLATAAHAPEYQIPRTLSPLKLGKDAYEDIISDPIRKYMRLKAPIHRLFIARPCRKPRISGC